MTTSLLIFWFYGGILIVISSLEIFAAFSVLMTALTMDIKQQLKDLNNAIIRVDGNFTSERRIEIYRHLCEIIEFHSNAKELNDF